MFNDEEWKPDDFEEWKNQYNKYEDLKAVITHQYIIELTKRFNDKSFEYDIVMSQWSVLCGKNLTQINNSQEGFYGFLTALVLSEPDKLPKITKLLIKGICLEKELDFISGEILRMIGLDPDQEKLRTIKEQVSNKTNDIKNQIRQGEDILKQLNQNKGNKNEGDNDSRSSTLE